MIQQVPSRAAALVDDVVFSQQGATDLVMEFVNSKVDDAIHQKPDLYFCRRDHAGAEGIVIGTMTAAPPFEFWRIPAS